jgi:hypothetical protein
MPANALPDRPPPPHPFPESLPIGDNREPQKMQVLRMTRFENSE